MRLASIWMPTTGISQTQQFKAGASLSNMTPQGEDIVGNFYRPIAAYIHDQF